MKRYLIPILVILVLASGLVVGCGQEVRPTPTIQPDVPTKTQDEVCALVYSYLEARGNAMTHFTKRMEFLDMINERRASFQAMYQGNGKWQVRGCGLDLWNVYETSGAIEPANDEASAWLHYIQYWTR